MRAGLLAAVLMAGSGLACSSEPASEAASSEPSGRSSIAQPVIGGVPSGPERDAVLLMLANGLDRSTQCTATLIAPNLVATVRHCISVFQEGTFSCTTEGNIDLNRTRNPGDAGEMGPVFAPDTIAFYAGAEPDLQTPVAIGKEVFAAETDTICRNDLAFVVLDQSLDLPVAAVRLGRGTFPGEKTLIVGYGINGTGTTSRHERAAVDILHVGPSNYFPLEGEALPRTFVVGPSACSGDSGGPAFSEETGAVVGASSLSRGACESSEVRNFYTQLAPYEALAEQAFEAAGHEPLLDHEPPGNGAGGSAGGPGAGHAGAQTDESPRGGGGGGCTWAADRAIARPTGSAAFVLFLLVSAVWLLAQRRRRAPTPMPHA